MAKTLVFLTLLQLELVVVLAASERCSPDRLAVFRLVLHTHWTRARFPRQYPEWRPPAQWSTLVGRTHDANYALFREGRDASDGFRQFAEGGRWDTLDQDSGSGSGSGLGVFDAFSGASIPSGQGETSAHCFADGNHTLLSMAVRIIPSPDWFIGLDSHSLCKKGYWIDSASIELRPLDAGTDDGMTFTAPNWPSEPRRPVTRITAQEPSHPAASFHYADLAQLPPLATLHIRRERIYRLSSVTQQTLHHGLASDSDLYDVTNEVVPVVVASTSRRHRRRRLRKLPRAPGCKVGEWSAWSPCSASCGVGEMIRRRSVLRNPKKGGQTCPPLHEIRWCGEHTACLGKLFIW